MRMKLDAREREPCHGAESWPRGRCPFPVPRDNYRRRAFLLASAKVCSEIKQHRARGRPRNEIGGHGAHRRNHILPPRWPFLSEIAGALHEISVAQSANFYSTLGATFRGSTRHSVTSRNGRNSFCHNKSARATRHLFATPRKRASCVELFNTQAAPAPLLRCLTRGMSSPCGSVAADSTRGSTRAALLAALRAIDHARHAASAKTVVDVHHAHVRRAPIQHRQQRRHSAEARSVSDARRH